jgi:hypothetical protein
MSTELSQMLGSSVARTRTISASALTQRTDPARFLQTTHWCAYWQQTHIVAPGNPPLDSPSRGRV